MILGSAFVEIEELRSAESAEGCLETRRTTICLCLLRVPPLFLRGLRASEFSELSVRTRKTILGRSF